MGNIWVRVEEKRESNTLRSGCWCEERAQPAPAPETSSGCSVQGDHGARGRAVGRGEGRVDLHIFSAPEVQQRLPLAPVPQRACPSRGPASFSSSSCFCCCWMRA